MKRFQFPLERVLRYRRTQADLVRAKLSRLEAELAKMRQDRRDVMEGFQAEVRQADASSSQRLELGRYRMVVEIQVQRLDQAIGAKAKEVAAQRELYVKANQAAEVLDKVKGKQYERWEQDLAKELDSLAMDSYLSRWKQ
jgi:flagellar export protein FliJ